MRKAVIGSFLESQGYQYEFIDRNLGHKFFQLQQRSDLANLQKYLAGQSAHLVRELEFVMGLFADEFDFEILSPEETYRFLLTRGKLRYGWRPRGRHHRAPSDFMEQFEINDDGIAIPSLSTGELRSDYSIEWVAGVFDGVCRYRPSISQSSEHTVGYAMYPVARLHRAGVHQSLVDYVQRFCGDYNLRYGNSSSHNELGIVFTGPSFIRRVLDVLFPRLLVLAEHSAAILDEVLPRFDDEKHHTRQGFYDLLRDFDPIARDSGGPFRHRKYDPEHFANIWRDSIELTPRSAVSEPDSKSKQERLDERETLTISPNEYKSDLGRYQTLVDRRYRDAKKVDEIKALYGDRCQLCGDRLARGDGTGYSEAHHLRPLGRPHEGPDILENMIILCPNHHADFDNGVIMIDRETMRLIHPYDSEVNGRQITMKEDHELAAESIQYHNNVISELERPEREESQNP